MSDLRLEELPFEFEGKTYLLRANMNVLADVQEVYGGAITDALTDGRPYRSVMEFLAAMMNDYAEEMGWPERFTRKSLGRKLSQGQVPMKEIFGLVTRAIIPPQAVSGADTEEQTAEDSAEDPGDSGN